MVGYNKDETITPNQKLLAGCMAGMMARFITQPMDVIKVRTQLQKVSDKKKKTWFTTTARIYKEEGMFAFWHGHNLGQVHSVLSVSCQFYVYELATKYITNAHIDEKYKYYLFFGCGMLAGCCGASLVFPIEVIRVRQMLVKEQYTGIVNGAMKVYNSGGILAFYEGLSASLLQMGPQVGIAFSVFRLTQPRLLVYLQQCRGETDRSPRPEDMFLASSVAGSVAGFVSKTMTYPFDLIKRRLQIYSHQPDPSVNVPASVRKLYRCPNIRQCFIKTYQNEGIFGFFKGWKVTVIKAQLYSITVFTAYELSCLFITKFFNEPKPV